MTKKMLIDATHAEETRVVVVDGTRIEEFDFESLNKRQLAGNIYLAKVTRVEPSLQAAFVDYGGNRHGFLAFSEIHPDYYQIPKADRDALLKEEAEAARHEAEQETREKPKARTRARSRKKVVAESAEAGDAVIAGEVPDAAHAEVPETEGAPESDAAPEGAPRPDEGAAEIEAAGQIVEGGEAAADAGEAEAAPTRDASEGEEGAAGDRGAANGGEPREAEYEAVGGDDVEEERRAPKARYQRRYKIQEVIKVRQILLVQVVKEERGNKGAALTTYLSLAGRYCVLMPNTARGGGISRKITSATDRKKLKDIASSFTVPPGAGLIIRTAGANRTKTEIKRDYEYLLRQWEQIRDLTLKSIAPKLIYEEGNLIRRVIRDLYSRDIDEILVDGERGYREAKDYMKMLMPSHARFVKHYAEPLPLFSRFQVESYLSAMFNPVVQLKSGGYIVIDVTEALVAIDVNSGRATREASVEETALKTNLEAAEEAARQMRLRDLAGLIVIDFIDMEDRKNNAAVEKRVKDKLKTDRARIQVGRISGFGLLEMSRQRLRPGMIEATTKGCPHCHGTGRVRSDDSMALALLRELEEEGVRARSKEVLVACPVEIANYLLNQKREHIAMIEARFGLSVRIEGDPTLISPDYRIERFKTASRIIPSLEAVLPAVPYPDDDESTEEETGVEAEGDADADAEDEDEGEGDAEAQASGDRRDGKKRRRRRRRGGRKPGEAGSEGEAEAQPMEERVAGEPAAVAERQAPAEAGPAPEPVATEGEEAEAASALDRSKSRRRSRSRKEPGSEAPVGQSPFDEVIEASGDGAGPEVVEVPESEAPQRRTRERIRKPAAAVIGTAMAVPALVGAEAGAGTQAAVAPAEPEAAPSGSGMPEPEGARAEYREPEPVAAGQDEGAATGHATTAGSAPADGMATDGAATGRTTADGGGTGENAGASNAPKKRGWWSRALGTS